MRKFHDDPNYDKKVQLQTKDTSITESMNRDPRKILHNKKERSREKIRSQLSLSFRFENEKRERGRSALQD